MSKWYGSLNNRVDENKQFCDEIKVGTGVTEYFWSDRKPYEVVSVENQKHVVIRPLKHTRKEGSPSFSNSWVLSSDESADTIEVVKRGNYWYSFASCTPEMAKQALDDIDLRLWLCNHDFDIQEIIKTGKTKTRYFRKNLSFGVAEYYYDYSF